MADFQGIKRRELLTLRAENRLCLAGCGEYAPCSNEWDGDPPAPRGKHSPVSALRCDRCGRSDLTSAMHAVQDADGVESAVCEECL